MQTKIRKLLILCALGGAVHAAKAEATNYSWNIFATNVTAATFRKPSDTDGIIYASNQMGLAAGVRLAAESLANAQIACWNGDGGKYVKLTTDSDGYFKLAVYNGSGTTLTPAVSRMKATAGYHRIALLMRRGDSGSGQRAKYAAAIIDGAETIVVASDSVNYSTGPFRNVAVGGTEGNLVSAAIWSAAAGITTDVTNDLQLVEADAAALYPILENSPVKWSNLDDTTNAKATHFTKGSEATKLLLTAQPGVPVGRRVIVTAVKIINNSSKTMQPTMTINGAISETNTYETIDTITGSANGGTYTFDRLYTYVFPVGSRPVVNIGTEYPIATPGDNQLSAIYDLDSPIQITGFSGNWSGFNGYCAVEGLAAPEPEAVVESVAVASGVGYAGGTVTATFTSIFAGCYDNAELAFVLRFAGVDEPIFGERNDNTVVFTLPAATFPAGQVYRGSLVMAYPDGEMMLAPVAVYGGEQMSLTESGWVHETSATLGATGDWTAGATHHREFIEADADGGVTFTPVGSADYVGGCDSTFTVALEADEALAATDTPPADNVQAAVRIAGARGAMKVEVFADDAWQTLCDARYGEVYAVTVAFAFAKAGSEIAADRVTYMCNGASISGARRTVSPQPVTNIAVTDGTRLQSILGERELDKAIVVDVEIAPGETKELCAADDLAAAAEAERMVVAISEAVAAALPTDEAKTTYRSYFKVVVAPQPGGGYQASVAFAEAPELRREIEAEVNEAVKRVVANIQSDCTEAVGRPGLFYGVLYGDEPQAVATPGPKSMADAAGRVEIVLPQPVDSVNRRFYRVICSPSAE